MTVGVGVIGAGLMGAAHVQTIGRAVAGATVVAVSDADRARASAVAAGVAGARVADEPLALIGDPDVEAVVIASSDETHEGFVLACLEARKAVLCEKPLATTAAAALRVTGAEAAHGRRLVQVGFMRRYDPAYAALKRRLDAGELGAPLLVHCAHRNRRVPATFTSEMLITSSATHEIDVARWLTGEEVVSATVRCARPTREAGAGLRDPQLVVLETEGGVLVDVEVFVNARYGYDIRCELVGERGTAALEPDVGEDFRERFAPAYRLELQDWVDGVRDDAASGPSAWDGYAASAVADACLESLAGGGVAPVRLEPRPPLYAPDGAAALP